MKQKRIIPLTYVILKFNSRLLENFLIQKEIPY